MRKDIAKLAVIALVGASFASGCRFKGAESFMSATTPNGAAHPHGDPYAGGGIAEASGGIHSETTYGKGAKVTNQKVDAFYDRPAKGTGQQPGDNSAVGAAGFGHTNAPSLQAMPSDVESTTVRSGR